MAGGVHGPGVGGAIPAYVDKGIGLSPAFSGAAGNPGGAGAAGHARTYLGTTYAKKPAFKKMLTDSASYQQQAALFKEQRVAKHRDRLGEELTKANPDAAVVKECLKKLSQLSKHSPFKFAPNVSSNPAERTAMGAQLAAIRQGIATVAPQLAASYRSGLQTIAGACRFAEQRLLDVAAEETKSANFAAEGMTFATDATKDWQYSLDGQSGAALVRANPGGPLEKVVKIDHPTSFDEAMQISELMTYVSRHADSPLPFVFPEHKLCDLSAVEVAAIKGKLQPIRDQAFANYNTLKAQLPPDTHEVNDPPTCAASSRLRKLDDAMSHLTNHAKALKQEALSGATCSNATTAEKIAALNDPEFGVALGMSVILCPMLGLGDHVNPDNAGIPNFSNMMLTADGKLGVIDLASSLARHGIGHNATQTRVGFDPARTDLVLGSLVRSLSQIAGTITPDNAATKLRNAGPLSQFADALLTPGIPGSASFLSSGEAAAVNDPVTGVDKNKLAANVFKGLVQGIEYVERNRGVFAEAHTAMGNGWQPADQVLKGFADALSGLSTSKRAALKSLA